MLSKAFLNSLRIVLAFPIGTYFAEASVTHSSLSSARPTSSASHVSPTQSLTNTSISSFPPAATPTSSSKNPADLVNLFVGTTNGGHVFPGQRPAIYAYLYFPRIHNFAGATLPHGMVKVGMDTDSPGNVRAHTLYLSKTDI